MRLIGGTDQKNGAGGGTVDPIDVHVGRRLRLARTAMGWSRFALADRLGLSEHKVEAIESGRSQVGVGQVYRMAELLDVSIQFFFDGMPPMERDLTDDPLPLNQFSRQSSERIYRGALSVAKAYLELEDQELTRALEDLLVAMGKARLDGRYAELDAHRDDEQVL